MNDAQTMSMLLNLRDVLAREMLPWCSDDERIGLCLIRIELILKRIRAAEEAQAVNH